MTSIFTHWAHARSILVLIVLFGFGGGWSGAAADPGPFAGFNGSWTGGGTITLGNGNKERLRCRATYRVRSSSESDLDLSLGCSSDNYRFEFTGNVRSDSKGSISGRWSETSRNVGGTIIGRARGERIQVLVESSAFSAVLQLATRGGRQSVSIKSQGGGETATASITLRRH